MSRERIGGVHDGLPSESEGAGGFEEPKLRYGSLKKTRGKGLSFSFGIPGTRRRVSIPARLISLLVALSTFIILLNAHVVKGEGDEVGAENRCLAILVFCTILWATEAIPLFVISLLVPFLLVVFRAVREQGENAGSVLDPKEATKCDLPRFSVDWN